MTAFTGLTGPLQRDPADGALLVKDPRAGAVNGLAQLDANQRLAVSQRPDSIVELDDYLPGAATTEAAIASAVAAATANGQRGTVRWTPGKVYTLTTGPYRMLRDAAGFPGVRMEGRGAILRCCPDGRCVDINKVADHDTFSKYTWHDFVFDGQNIGGDVWVVGTTQSRVNLKRLGFYWCEWINVPTDTTGATQRRCFDIGISHPTDNEATQSRIEDITLWGCRWNGGNYGGIIAGSSQAGVLPNIFIDRILIVDPYYDSGIANNVTGHAAAALQIGVTAQVGTVWVVRPEGRNPGDVNFEFDNVQRLVVVDPISKDPRDGHYLCRNFRPPLDVHSQVNILVNPKVINENFVPTLADESRGYNIQGTEPFGQLILVNPEYENRTNGWPASRGQALHAYGAAFWGLKIVGKFLIARVGQVNVPLNANAQDIVIASTINGAVVDPGTLHFKRRGSAVNNVGPIYGAEIRSYDTGAHTTVLPYTVIVDNGLTGAPGNGNTRWVRIGGGGGLLTHRCGDAFYVPGNAPNDTQPKLFDIVSALAGISGLLEFDRVDSTNAPSGSAVDFNFQNANVKPVTKIHKYIPKSGYPINSTAIVVGASPFAYQNVDGYREQAVVQGGTVTKIEIGRNSPTYVDTGAIAGAFVLENADYIRTAYISGANGTGDTTNGANTIANVTGTWRVGNAITGAGIPAGTTIIGINGTTLTLSANATATAAGVALSGTAPTITKVPLT